MKIINFRGDLTDNSAKKEALDQTPNFVRVSEPPSVVHPFRYVGCFLVFLVA